MAKTPPGQFTGQAVLDAMLEVVPNALCVMDSQGNVVAFNEPFEALWRGASGTLPSIGRALPQVMSEIAQIQERALSGRSVSGNARFVVDGVERAYVITARPVGGGVDGIALCVAESKRRDAAARAPIGLEQALHRLFASAEPTSSALVSALEFLCTTYGWDAALLWTIDHDALRTSAMFFRAAAIGDRLRPRIETLRYRAGKGVPGRAWSSGEVVWIPDVLEESGHGRADFAETAGLHSAIGVPLHGSGRVTGVVEFFTEAVRPIDADVQSALTHIGAVLGHLIDNRRAEDERGALLLMIERKGLEWMITFDSIQMPIFVLSSDGTVRRANRAACAFSGSESFDRLVGRRLSEFGAGEPWKTLMEIVAVVHQRSDASTAQIQTDESIWDVAASHVAATADEEERIIIAMRDITEVVRLQESVRRGEQLAVLGELVAGVAHEVKNPIFGLGVTLELIEQQAGHADPDMIAGMRKWLDRLHTLADNLLEYGKTWNVDLKPGSVAGVVKQAVESMSGRAAEAGVILKEEIATDDVVLMDASRLVLVFENVIANAVQHTGRGETVHVETAPMESGIEICVRDHGPGFVEADLPRIFQPFFTRRRGGTGLGLSIVHRIVDQHGGTVNASNDGNGGAVIRIHLPRHNYQRIDHG